MANQEKELPVSTSTPPEFPPEQHALFCSVLKHMNACGLPYVVSGAFALQKHTGIWRNTKDLDLFLPAEVVPSALQYLEQQGFETEICDSVWLAKAHRDDYFVDLIAGMSNAIITVDMSWIERGTDNVVLGIPTKVLGPEELIASKLFVDFRERFDGADIVHIIYASKGKLDWDRIRQLVGDHWEILLWQLVLFHYVYPNARECVPGEVWNDLLNRLQGSLGRSDARPNFRGTLLDEKMFAIDVKEWGLDDPLVQQRARREPKIVALDGSPKANDSLPEKSTRIA